MKKLLFILLLCSSAFAQQNPMLGEQVNRAHQLGDFVGAWVMNEGSGNKVFDLSGNRNIGTLQGTTSWSAGKFGSALLGDGSLTCVLLATPIIPATGDFTLIFWLNPSTSNGHNVATQYGAAQDGRLTFQHGATTANKFKCFIANSGGSNVDFESTNTFPANSWYHVVYRRKGSVFDLLVNTALEGTQTEAGVSIYQGANTRFGFKNGLTDNGLIYNRALSDSEIALHYRNSFCMFEKDDIAIMAKAASRGQVIIIQMAAIPLLLIPTLIFIKRRKLGE